MNNVSTVMRTIGVASTAALSFGACASTACATAFECQRQAQSECHVPTQEYSSLSYTTDLARFLGKATLASGANSLALKFYSSDQLESAAKEFIFGLKDHQVDMDLETKALISENLWDLYG